MLSPRGKKVLNDLWTNRSRTVLVILSITVGITALGMIATSQEVLGQDMAQSYSAINPARATLFTDDPFDEDMVQAVRRMRNVDEAEGRRSVNVRFLARPGEWRQITLFAIADYDDMRVNKVSPEQGDWPPPEHALLVERGSMEAGLGLDGRIIGDTLLVEPPSGKVREMRIAGLTHDLSQIPAVMSDAAYGYITFETLEWLGEPSDFDELHIVVAGAPTTKQEVWEVAKTVERKVEKAGHMVISMQINEPGKSPVDETIQTVLLLMGVLGVFSLLLSTFLVVNTISAVLTQHVKHIGIMKSIGARTGQIMRMYLAMVLVFGLCALVIGVPLGALGAYGNVSLVSGMLNYDVGGFRLSPGTVLLQAVVGLLVPLLAALYPVIAGVRVTVREAISGYGLTAQYGQSFIDRVLQQVRILSRPNRLALRNTFRKRGRLILTLMTLVIAGAAFIAILSLRDALLLGLDEMFNYFRYDVEVTFAHHYRVEEMEREAMLVPDVVDAESWLLTSAFRVRDDGSESNRLQVTGLPSVTELMVPVVVEGRWLLPEDENAIVLNTQAINEEPDIEVGDEIVLKIEGQERLWQVVGRVKTAFVGPRLYTNYPYLSQLVNSVGRANKLQVVTNRHDAQYQAQILQEMESRLKRRGMRISATQTSANVREFSEAGYGIMIAFLMVMALLLALVGGLGLMGTMGINVMERTREIGVMRAIGASNGAVMQNVMSEGIIIGWMGWVFGLLAAVPVSKVLSEAVGMAFMQEPLSHTYSWGGALLWLILITVIAALASFLPARRASKLTVREVLAYA